MKKITLINILTLILALLFLSSCRAPLSTDTETEIEREDPTDVLYESDTGRDSSTESETATDESTSDSSTETTRHEPIPDVEDVIIEMNDLLVTYNGEYTVTICDGQRKVVFDNDGNSTKCVNITLIEDIKFDYTYRIKSIDQIKAELGDPHADVGKSGDDYIYTPSYVTNDGFLISFILDERNNANSAEKIDLFSGDIVDWIEIDYTPIETDTSTEIEDETFDTITDTTTDTNELNSEANTESSSSVLTDTDANSEIDAETDSDLSTDADDNTASNSKEETESSTDTSTTTETIEDEVIDVPLDTTTDTTTDIATDTTTETSNNTSSDIATDVNTETEAPEIPPEEIHTVTWQFNYDYGFHIESLATLLVDYSKLTYGFESITIPDDIVAGDTITIEYTGDMYILESYPGRTKLHGEVISYSFDYAHTIHYHLGEAYSIKTIKSLYEFDNAYVILDRSGKFVSLDEYTGDEIYLVVDQEKYQFEEDAVNPDIDEERPDEILPIACMLAYNPRDLKAGISTAGARNEKVSFDLDYHHFGDEMEKTDDKKDPTKFDFGYICKDENGNEFIAYAPNLYSYTVLVECTEEKTEAYNGIRNVLNQFNPWNSSDRKDIDIDTQDLPNNMILITFPDFDTYFTCQDELLDKLSVLECVKKIYVGYISSQNGTYSPKNPYVIYADVGSKYHKNDVFTAYEEYVNALGSCIENSEGLKKITEKTFESNYVFVVTNSHWREFKISDARLVDNTVYFTNNEFQGKNQIHDMIAYENSCVIVVPKDEIGELPENVSVKTVGVPIYIDGLANLTKIDEGDAITIAFAHFYANYNLTPEEGFAYVAQSIDGENNNYWYILIYKEYVGDTDKYDYVVKGEGFLYTISKNSGEIICIESGE